MAKVTLLVFANMCRCVLQLGALGYVLAPVFAYDAWWLVLLAAGAMTAVASAEIVSRPSASYKVCAAPATMAVRAQNDLRMRLLARHASAMTHSARCLLPAVKLEIGAPPCNAPRSCVGLLEEA